MFKTVFLLLVSLSLTACSSITKEYRDTSYLEKPPKLVIVEKLEDSEVVKDEPLNKDVFLDDIETPPVLHVKKLFDRSWELLAQELEKQKIEITDKNRDKGYYYVKFQPDEAEGHIFGGMKILLFEDSYTLADYRIHLMWNESTTEIRVKLLSEEEDISFDDEDKDEQILDGSEKLINVLYEGIEARLSE